jgi:hypothetical protein
VSAHTHTDTTHTVWACRLDEGEIVTASDQAAAVRAADMFRGRNAEVVHRHVTFTDWHTASHDHEEPA